MDVVIVESPAKAKTINKYLGSGYKVLASFGHVRDLPAKDGSVRPDDSFSMDWDVDRDSQKRLSEIAKAVKGANHLILATDPDREGEAISWHVLEVLKNKRGALKGTDVKRVVFNEITKSAILKAMEAPRDLDQQLVDAYLARRALDYLFGFTLSPVLWRKLPGARSAGRVQSVALRLIVDREMEIEAFTPREYWSVSVQATTPEQDSFTAKLLTLDGKKLGKFDLNDQGSAHQAVEKIKAQSFKVTSVDAKPTKRHPQPPFTTSTLQQEAARKLGFSATRTMQVAQKLYEGININGETTGLITYMRTDGVQMAGEAIAAARQTIASEFGSDFVPAVPRAYKTKAKNAQEAHEAIRPTRLDRKPEAISNTLDRDQFRLYELIWKRAIASQMESARIERTSVNISSSDQQIMLRATGSVISFAGFLKLYEEGIDDEKADDNGKRLPPMKMGDEPSIDKVTPAQHFTEPAPRFSEASLVKKLEELGIGRPSTYASILSVLRDRNYVRTEKNKFIPEDKGRLVTAFLENFFDRYVEFGFTAALEEQLDLVSDGKADWKEVLAEFWSPFKNKTDDALGLKISEVIDVLNDYLKAYLFKPRADGSDPRKCPTCDTGELSLKPGKFGAFIGCSNYPECRYTRQFSGEEDSASSGENGPKVIGQDPETGLDVLVSKGRFGPYIQLGETVKGSKPKRSSIPKDVAEDQLNLELALALLALPRTIGNHPETGQPITATIGRYGPYMSHAGSNVSLNSTEEVLSIGINRAVSVLAEGGKTNRRGSEALKELGAHPEDGKIIKVMSGRYGPYVTHNKVNASLPKTKTPDTITLEEALELLAARKAKTAKPKKKTAKAKSTTSKKTS